MTYNRRYKRQNDARQDARRAEAETRVHPISLPTRACGPEPFEQARESRSVHAWLCWTDGSVTRVEGSALSWNSRAVVVAFYPPWGGGEIRVTVWRNAVTHRVVDARSLLQVMTLSSGFEVVAAHGESPRVVAPNGQALVVSNVWQAIPGERPALRGVKLAAYRDARELTRGEAAAESDVLSFTDARREIQRWLALQLGGGAPAT